MKKVNMKTTIRMRRRGMKRTGLRCGLFVAFLSLLLFAGAFPVAATVIFSDDFETGQGDWNIENGIWEIGTPTSGPNGCHGGANCAGTVLSGNYPDCTDSRLISPPITLPAVTGHEEIQLRFWHWFYYQPGGADWGVVQISAYNPDTLKWSGWADISGAIWEIGAVWSLRNVDLTAYAGKRVKIAFAHVADCGSTYPGWYIDDVQVDKYVPVFSGDFEGGWGDWSADNGVWEIGTPTVGPKACYGGSNCAGTVLNGSYPDCTDSRLIMPTMTLPTVTGDKEVILRFWHWFYYQPGGADYGVVQISVNNGSGVWSKWANLSNPIVEISSKWSRKDVDLTAYAGKTVRIAFVHVPDCGSTYAGWYIDDVYIAPPPCPLPIITSFAAKPTLGPSPLHVKFTCKATDSDGTIEKYQWDFGDGNQSETDNGTIQHTYPKDGVYKPKVTVVDNCGGSTSKSTKIMVGINPELTGKAEEYQFSDLTKTINIKFRVTNSGNLAAGPFKVSFHLSTNGTTPLAAFKELQVDALGVKQSTLLDVDQTFTSSIYGKYILIYIDPKHELPELDDTTNGTRIVIQNMTTK